MADFLNEQEQVELIKHYWKKYGMVSMVTLLVVIFALSGWQMWQKRAKESESAASVDYQYLLQEFQAGESDKVNKIAQELMNKYPKTPYAGMAGLFLAEEDLSNKQLALADQHLSFAKDHLKNDLKSIAILRLARLKIAENQAKMALSLLEHPSHSFEALFEMTRGDAHLALGEKEKAKASYQSALAGSEDLPPTLKTLLQSKLSQI